MVPHNGLTAMTYGHMSHSSFECNLCSTAQNSIYILIYMSSWLVMACECNQIMQRSRASLSILFGHIADWENNCALGVHFWQSKACLQKQRCSNCSNQQTQYLPKLYKFACLGQTIKRVTSIAAVVAVHNHTN